MNGVIKNGFQFLFLLFVIMAIDIILWLSWSANVLYKPAYRRAGLPWKPSGLPGIGAWICIAIGLYFFVLPRIDTNTKHRLLSAFLMGALFGFVLYGTYDFTTLAIFPNLPPSIIVIDVLWGSLLCGTATFLVTWCLKK